VTPSVDILARTLYGESEVRDETDARAIASVVMNRARFRRQSVEKVCLAPKQFSCWNEEKDRTRLMKLQPTDNEWAHTCFKIAEAYAEGGALDITNGATHYYATYIKAPKWARGKVPCFSTPQGKYNHVFFNDIDGPRQRDREVLDQHAPLNKDAIVQGSQIATGGTVVGGVIEAITQASDTLQPFAYYLEWAQWIVIGLTLLGLAYTMWSRYKARKDGAL
jgi:N-acetylmuramoyl-L-alanine amidase